MITHMQHNVDRLCDPMTTIRQALAGGTFDKQQVLLAISVLPLSGGEDDLIGAAFAAK